MSSRPDLPGPLSVLVCSAGVGALSGLEPCRGWSPSLLVRGWSPVWRTAVSLVPDARGGVARHIALRVAQARLVAARRARPLRVGGALGGALGVVVHDELEITLLQQVRVRVRVKLRVKVRVRVRVSG